MGPEIAFAWMAMSVISGGASMFQKNSAAESRLRALDLQAKQSTIRHQQELLSNYDILEQTLHTQQAEATAKGVGMGSLSFEAIQRGTINKIAKEEKNLNIEESLFQRGIKIEKENVKKTLYASLFGDIAQTGFNFAELSKSVSKKG
jgi:hypothetical protein